MNSHSNFLDKEQAEIRAWKRKFRGMVSDALKSHEQMVAEELLEIQAERVAKQAELETRQRLAKASQQGREKAVNEFPASHGHAAAPESPPGFDIYAFSDSLSPEFHEEEGKKLRALVGEMRERERRTLASITPPIDHFAQQQRREAQRRIELAGLEERERIRVREEHEANKAKAQDAAPVAHPRAPLQRSAAQDLAVLSAICDAGYSPLALPVNTPGKPGVKSVIRKALDGNNLFTTAKIFDKTWERLRERGDIADKG